jgi:hypothetical protein
MNFGELDDWVHEEILLQIDDPTEIAAEVSKLMNGLRREDVFVVLRLATRIAGAIRREKASKDGDMVEVVRKLSAVLEPMTAWLDCRGVTSRAFRLK